jgi:hypothetical protein
MHQRKMTPAERGNEPSAHPHLATRGFRALFFAILATVASLAVLVTPALAVEGHVYSKSFGAGELSLGGQSGIAINQENGELYVGDTGNSRVAKFTATGVPDGGLATVDTPTFVAVDNSSGSSGDVYVVNSSNKVITKYSSSGAVVAGWGIAGSLTGLGNIFGIATDPQGNLWVMTGEPTPRDSEKVVRQFSPTGSLLSQFGRKIEALPLGLAVDSAQSLYIFAGGSVQSGDLRKLSSTGQILIFDFAGSTAQGAFVVDQATDNVYRGGTVGGVGNPTNQDGVGVTVQASSGQIVETFAEAEGTQADVITGIAVRAATEEAYLVKGGAIKDYPVVDVAPPIVSIDAPTAVTTTTAHVAGHINPNSPSGNPPSYDVNWKFSCAPASCTAPEGEISADDQNHTVEGTLEGLEPGTKYTVTLTASNALNHPTASTTFKTAPVAPQVLEQFPTNITPTEADLNAVIKPRGAPTTYRFEYVPEAAFLAEGFASSETRSTLELGPIDEEAKQQEVSARASDLAPGAPYRFRVVATNSVAPTAGPPAAFRTQLSPFVPETDCPNQPFRTGAGALLPDCRAYEQASPVDKGGLGAEGFIDYFAAADDGSGATFFSNGGTGIPASGGAHQEFVTMLSSRNGESWTMQRLLAPEATGQTGTYLGASADLRYALIESCLTGIGAGTGCGLFLEDTAGQTFTEIVPRELNQLQAPRYGFGSYAYDSISADGSRVFFETKAQITPDAAAGKGNLYMWDRASGAVSLVGVLPGATPKAPSGGSFGGAYEWAGSGVNLNAGGSLAGLYVEAIHAISEEGDKAYFTAGGNGQIYLRRNLTGPNPSTLQVSAPEAGVTDPNGTKPAVFLEATPDGSRAFFFSSQKLTKDATTGPLDKGADLYRYDAATKALVDVTPDPAGTNPDGAGVLGLLGASRDGTSGYFAAEGVLAAGASAGANNIYRFEEESDGGFSYAFVATTDDRRNWSPTSSGRVVQPEGSEFFKNSRVTPDARTLVFSATSATSRGCEISRTALCRELFMYSVDHGGPFCVSCNPTGDKSFGDATLSTVDLNAYLPPRGFIEQRLTRNLTADGTRLFFQSPDPLVAGDTNASEGCTYYSTTGGTKQPDCVDVYEWEAPGSPGGSCKSAEVNGGCLYLLSTGKSKDPSNFIDMSADGRDVFIATASQLVPVDRDELFDVYDVGVGRGLVAQQAVPGPPCASGEACQGAGSGSSADPSPGTATFQGSGNSKAGGSKHKRCGKKGAHKSCGKSKKGKHHRKHQSSQGKHRVKSTKGGGSR